jgi:hypothetical protein
MDTLCEDIYALLHASPVQTFYNSLNTEEGDKWLN